MNGTNILNATNATLTLAGGQTTNTGNYSVLVSNLSESNSSATVALTVSNAPAGVALPSGAVAWWRAESNYLDSVGSNNGTAENGLGFAPGEVGLAFNVSSGQYLVINPASPSNLDVGQAAGFTFEEWIKPATVSAEELLFEYERVLGTYAGTDTGIGFSIHPASPGGVLYANLVDTNFISHEFTSPATLLVAGVWQHVALTYDKTSGLAAIYLNGASVAATNIGTITLRTSFTNLLLGARTTFNSAANPGARYTGLIDESAIYNRALASNEIAAIYAAGAAGKTTGTAPVITTQPTSEVVLAGGTASFTVSATGTAPLSYQWLFNGTNLPYGTNITLVLTRVQAANAGNYSVVVTNLYGLASSATAVLTVSNAPTGLALPSGAIAWWRAESNYLDSVGSNNGTAENGLGFAPGEVGQAFWYATTNADVKIPASTSLDVGAGNGFTLEAWVSCSNVNNLNPIFEWNQGDGTTQWGVHLYVGAAGSGSLYANIVDSSGSWHRISSSQGVVATNVFTHVALTYNRTNGVATIYCNGANVAQSSLGSFRPQTSYSLYLGRRPGPEETIEFAGLIDESTVYNRALTSNEIAAIYAAGSYGKLGTNTGTAPVITAQPTSEVVLAGGTASFTVSATGTAPLSYQWLFNGTNLSYGTNTTLVLTGVQAVNAGNYSVVVTNLYGLASSATAVLTVSNAPTGVALPSGAVAWWRAESNYLDSVGSNNGTAENGLGFAPGEVGQAFWYATTNADVKIPASTSLDVGAGNGFTLEAWVSCSNVNNLNPIFEWNQGDGATQWGVHFYVGAAGSGSLYANIVDSSGSWHRISSSQGVVATNVFTHVALTYNRTNGVATIYCNGANVAQSSLGSFRPQTSYSLYLGRRPGPEETIEFAGLIDESTVYNRALTSNEVAAIYAAGSYGKLGTNTGTAPVITTQPTSEVVLAGGTASFTVSATGTAPLSYQWLFNGTNLPYGTNITLVLTRVQAANAGNYSVVVTNLYGLASSATAVLTVSNAPTGVALPSGAVAWWRAESNYLDSVGSNNGTAENGLGFAPGEVGQAFRFATTNADAKFPASTSLDVGAGNGFTLEAWVSCSNVNNLNPIFEWNQGDGATQWGVHFYVGAAGSGSLYANIVDSSGSWHRISSSQGVVATNVFTHVALTYNRTNGVATIYCNGTNVAQSSLGSFRPQTSYSLYLGRRPGPEDTIEFAGLIDESTIYNRALASNEIAAIYAAGSYGKLATTSTNSIVSVASVVDHFTWSQIASPRFANTPFTVTVQAKNSHNEVCSNFTGTALLTATNGVKVSPSVSASFSQGVWTGTATISTPTTNLVLEASDNASHVGVANAITVAARPTLSLKHSKNSLVFAWPAEVSDFAVEATTNLSSGQWSTIDATSSVVGNQHEQVLPISNTNQLYFRLRYTAP